MLPPSSNCQPHTCTWPGTVVLQISYCMTCMYIFRRRSPVRRMMIGITEQEPGTGQLRFRPLCRDSKKNTEARADHMPKHMWYILMLHCTLWQSICQ